MIAINLLTCNELVYVKNLIRQLRPIADEIYICDDYSKDGTWEWLNDNQKRYGLTLFQRQCNWKPGAQRNFLLSKTPRDCWVIKIDCDEVPTFGFRFMIREVLNSASNPPEEDRIFYYVYNLVRDFNHYHEDIGVQWRIFWNSEKNNAYYVDEPHEELRGNFGPSCGVVKFEQGVVHLKLLDKEKVRIGRTDYVKHGIYMKDNIGELFETGKFEELPKHIGFDVTTEIIKHLGLEHVLEEVGAK